MSRYDEGETDSRLALPEDVELRGFLPLVPAHVILKFSGKSYIGGDGNKEKKARVQRIIAAGKAITTNFQSGQQGIYYDLKSRRFVFGVEPINANEVSVTNGESEDEDEVILFKPPVFEKSKDVGIDTTLSMSHVDPTASSVNGNMHFATSKWMAGTEENIETGFRNLNLSGNGFHTGPAREISSGVIKSDGFGSSNEVSFQDPDTMIPSKFDSVMTSAPGLDSVPSKSKFFKSPVSRPVRHFGPPPGFNTTVSKHVRNENTNPALDDYSWLDGYQLPYSAYNDGFGNSLNCLPQPSKLLNMNKTSLGMESFPFPGKQVSSVVADVRNGNKNGWLDYQIPERSSIYQGPGNKVNEQFIGASQQYQGQSLWEGRYFV